MSICARIIRIIASIYMVVVNVAANILPIGGMTTGQVSDSLHTLITPIGWTFGIWSVIYLGLGLVMILVAWGQINVTRHIVRAYVISCLCNAAWIFVRHMGWLTAAMLIIVGLLISLIMLDRYVQAHEVEHFPGWFRSIFLVYIGWVQIATLIMLTIYLIYGVELVDVQHLGLPLGVLIGALLSNLWILFKARRFEPALVFIWALIGISLGQTEPAIRTTCMIVGSILLIAMAFRLNGLVVKK